MIYVVLKKGTNIFMFFWERNNKRFMLSDKWNNKIYLVLQKKQQDLCCSKKRNNKIYVLLKNGTPRFMLL